MALDQLQSENSGFPFRATAVTSRHAEGTSSSPFPGGFISVSVYSLANRQLIRSRLSAGLKQSSMCDGSTFLFAIVLCLKETCKISHHLLCVMMKVCIEQMKETFQEIFVLLF